MTEKIQTLLLFTDTYPYSLVAESFLDQELPFLTEAFEKVILIPRFQPREEEFIQRELPKNVTVEHSLIRPPWENLNLVKKIFYLVRIGFSFHLYQEIIQKPIILFHITSIKKLAWSVGNLQWTKNWLKKFLEKNHLQKALFYTYWLNEVTYGIGFIKKKYPSLVLISRAHGGDLYEERYSPAYIPFRPAIFNSITKVFTISIHGKEYLSQKYPDYMEKFFYSRLGVSDPGFYTKSSDDDVFRIVSCSYIVPLKRLELLIAGIEELGRQKPDKSIQWTHIGYGPSEQHIKTDAKKYLKDNVSYQFLGYLSNDEVISYYSKNPIDVFMNVSSFEGIPVSIMEVQSCGIPVIASAVGGTPEIVSDRVGILLNANPTPEEIASALSFFIDDRENTRMKRRESKNNWRENFNAENNFPQFIELIKNTKLSLIH